MKEDKIYQLNSAAWRERWSDIQWGTNIKKVVPCGVSGDVYNLADCLLHQALTGSITNRLSLRYLRYSLCCQLVSYAATLRYIANYDHLDNICAIQTLLKFLESMISGGITCRKKTEEAILPGAVVNTVYWLVKVFAATVKHYELHGELTDEQTKVLDQTCLVIDQVSQNSFLMGIYYIGRHEEPEIYAQIREKFAVIKNSLATSNLTLKMPITEQHLKQFADMEASHLEFVPMNTQHVEQISYCIQPLLAVEVLMNPCKETAYYVAELQMLQRLKSYSNARLYYEIIRADFISLSSVVDTSHDTVWSAFTFFKVPQIIKQLHAVNHAPDEQTPTDYIPDVVEALEMLLEDNVLLDFMDSKCSCNIIEFLLNDWTKQYLINEMHVKHFTAIRESACAVIPKREGGNQSPSMINFIIRAEGPLSGVLKTLSADYNKVQEALLGVLCQVLVGNTFDLILSVAAVEGRLQTFVTRLIQCNENSKQVPGEVGKPSVIRSTLFDVSFLMLTFIVQTYGADEVLPKNGDSFFEKWVRECLVERLRLKDPKQILALCDDNIVDELLLSLSKPEAQIKSSNLTWQDICMNLPGVLHHVLVAWEKETLSSADVKNILDNIKRRLFSFSVCATSFLCTFLYAVRETELLKPLNMIQQFLAPPTSEEMSTQENVKERLGLSFQIIRKIQQDVHLSSNPKSRSIHSLISQLPLVDQFRDVWSTVASNGWLPVRAAQTLETLLEAGGSIWLTNQLVEQILQCKYTRDMAKTMDIVFAILHFQIELFTKSLLEFVILPMIQKRQGDDINEPQSLVLARLCVYCVISCLEKEFVKAGSGAVCTTTTVMGQLKRTRSLDDEENINTAKIRKIVSGTGGGDGSDNSCSNEFTNESTAANNFLNNTSSPASSSLVGDIRLSENMEEIMRHVFKVFLNFVSSDELSPKILFVYQFLSLLVECGGDRIRSVLRLMPPTLVQNLLKVFPIENIRNGLISRLHDLRGSEGRQVAVSNMCLLRNIQLSQECIQL